ncbi:sterol carrier protein 2 [Nucella lapillus]
MGSQRNGKVFVVGVGMTKFEKPGSRENFDYPDMAKEAGSKALQDAGLTYNQVQQACCGYVYGDTTCGQRALYQLGMTGIPIYNVNNACCSGSTALFMAKQLVEGGMADCVMAIGFEKMERGPLKGKFDDRTSPLDKHVEMMVNLRGFEPSPVTAQLFGNAAKEHMEKYGTTKDHLAKIAYKNHKHSTNNPYSQFQKEYSLEEIQKSSTIFAPLTKLQCCPTSDGSAAVILASEDFVSRHNLQSQAVEIVGMEMGTDTPATFGRSSISLVGYDMTKDTADRLFDKTGLQRRDVDVVELHDCFSANELITYEALGLCEPGKAGEFIDKGDNTYGGRVVVNPSGGLISKGHPLGATGLAQCSELCWQLRGEGGGGRCRGPDWPCSTTWGWAAPSSALCIDTAFPTPAGESSHPPVSPHTRRHQIQAAVTSSGPSEADFKAAVLFKEIAKRLEQDGANIVKKMEVFAFIHYHKLPYMMCRTGPTS